MRLLLLSNSTNAGGGYLEHATGWIKEHLGPSVKTIAFVPYAGVTIDHDEYTQKVKNAIEPLGYTVQSVHNSMDPVALVQTADAIAVGGGNTFQLVKRLYEQKLMEIVGNRVRNGVPYIGWSAGSNVACPTLKTTNDMPIAEPESFQATGLIPFQINPHYLDAHPDSHMGETREQRLLEFLTLNDVTVVGLREGTALKVIDNRIKLLGDKRVRIFFSVNHIVEHEPGDDLSFLLNR